MQKPSRLISGIGQSQTTVKTLIHPGAHVYPPWAPQQIVTFFKNHKL